MLFTTANIRFFSIPMPFKISFFVKTQKLNELVVGRIC